MFIFKNKHGFQVVMVRYLMMIITLISLISLTTNISQFSAGLFHEKLANLIETVSPRKEISSASLEEKHADFDGQGNLDHFPNSIKDATSECPMLQSTQQCPTLPPLPPW